MSKNKHTPFSHSHFGINDYDFWFNTRPLEETELLFKYGSKLISDAGIHWDRVHLPGIFSWNVMEPVKGKYDWTIPDALVKAAQSYGINLLPNLWLFAAWDQKAWEGKRPIKIDNAVAEGTNWVVDDTCPIPPRYDRPHDVEAYSRWITAMVERYDGDGVDDMPGLKYPIKYWEPMNEVWGTGFWVPAPVTSHKSFAEITKVTYLAAKKADPECKIVLANANERFYRAIMDLGNRDEQQYFDVINLHIDCLYRFMQVQTIGEHIHDQVLRIKGLLAEYGEKAEIWFTEFGSGMAEPAPFPRPITIQVPFGDEEPKPPYPKPRLQERPQPSESPPRVENSFHPGHVKLKVLPSRPNVIEKPKHLPVSPRRQAANLMKALTAAFYNKVEKVFFQGLGPIKIPGVKLTEPIPASYGNYSVGIMLDPEGKPRPVYYTAQLFMEKLDMFERIEKLNLGKNIEAYKYIMNPMFKPESEFLYVLWSDEDASVTLTGLENSFVTVIDTVLKSGRRFKITCVKVVDGKVKLKLSEEPVIVEP